jgi:hypothetical protein
MLAVCPVGLGMIALPERTWMGSMVGGGVVVGRGAVGVPLPHALRRSDPNPMRTFRRCRMIGCNR